jgi:hypothetical protein
MGMNKIASNLEAAKRELSYYLEKDYKRKYEGFDQILRNYDWYDIDAGGVFGQ